MKRGLSLVPVAIALTGGTVSKIVRDQLAQAGFLRRHCTKARSKATPLDYRRLCRPTCNTRRAHWGWAVTHWFSSLCNSNADDTSCCHCTYEIELLTAQVTRIRPHFDVIPGRVRVMPGSAIPGRNRVVAGYPSHHYMHDIKLCACLVGCMVQW